MPVRPIPAGAYRSDFPKAQQLLGLQQSACNGAFRVATLFQVNSSYLGTLPQILKDGLQLLLLIKSSFRNVTLAFMLPLDRLSNKI